MGIAVLQIVGNDPPVCLSLFRLVIDPVAAPAQRCNVFLNAEAALGAGNVMGIWVSWGAADDTAPAVALVDDALDLWLDL